MNDRFHTQLRVVVLAALLVALALILPRAVNADAQLIDFTGYTVGDIHGQDGWSKTGTYDVAVVDQASLGLSYAGFGSRSLRISNAVGSGSFGDQTFSKSLVDEAGEAGAANGGMSGGTRQPFFAAGFQFASTKPASEQVDLWFGYSPDRGDGARMSYVRFFDKPAGLEVVFTDFDSARPGTCGDGLDFVSTTVATGLDRTVPHSFLITMEFVAGPNNDIVNVYIDNALVHTGKSWENYFVDCEANPTRTVDSSLFIIRTSPAPVPGHAGFGFLVDNYSQYSGPVLCTTICYVDDAAGSDTNGGTSAADAFKTIQKGIDTVLPGGEVRVLPGTYAESPDVTKSLTLVSTGGNAVTTIDLQTGTNYTHSLLVMGADVTIDGFTIEGIDAACPTLAATNIYVDSTADNVVIKNNVVKVGQIDLVCSTGDDGFGLITVYTAAPNVATLLVEDNVFEPLTVAGGRRAFYINPSVVDFTFRSNEINGLFDATAVGQAQNNVIEDNTVTGTGASYGLGVWGYPDPTVWGHGSFTGNTITDVVTGIRVMEAEDVTVTRNVLTGNGTGVSIATSLAALAFDESTIHINNNALTGNTSFGIDNQYAAGGDVDGTCNWWGDASGPGPVGPGSGDDVSAKVDFDPWLVSSDLDSLCLAADGFLVSAEKPGVTDDAVAYGMEDVLMWDKATGAWSKWFDGSDAGLLPNGKNKHNINDIYVPDPTMPEFYLAFSHNARNVPFITGKVDGMDIVMWDGSMFSMYFDGQDVGLTNKSQEKLDAFTILDGSLWPHAGVCTDYLLLSTQGPGQVMNHSGGKLKFGGEDVLGFCMTNSGASTTGLWTMVLDGSMQGMPRNSLAGLSAADDNTLYLTTKGVFNVDSASGTHSMVYAYDMATQMFSGPYWNATAEGLPTRVDAIEIDFAP